MGAGLGSARPSPGAVPRHPRSATVPAADNRTPANAAGSLPPRSVAFRTRRQVDKRTSCGHARSSTRRGSTASPCAGRAGTKAAIGSPSTAHGPGCRLRVKAFPRRCRDASTRTSVSPMWHVLDKTELMVYHLDQAAHSGSGAGLGSASPSPGPSSRHPGPQSSPGSPRAPPLRGVASPIPRRAAHRSPPRRPDRPAAPRLWPRRPDRRGSRGSSPRGRLMHTASAARSGGSTVVLVTARIDSLPVRPPPDP